MRAGNIVEIHEVTLNETEAPEEPQGLAHVATLLHRHSK